MKLAGCDRLEHFMMELPNVPREVFQPRHTKYRPKHHTLQLPMEAGESQSVITIATEPSLGRSGAMVMVEGDVIDFGTEKVLVLPKQGSDIPPSILFDGSSVLVQRGYRETCPVFHPAGSPMEIIWNDRPRGFAVVTNPRWEEE